MGIPEWRVKVEVRMECPCGKSEYVMVWRDYHERRSVMMGALERKIEEEGWVGVERIGREFLGWCSEECLEEASE